MLATSISGCSGSATLHEFAPKAIDRSPLTFAVISDTHFGNEVGEGPKVKVTRALQNITSHGRLDALVVVGDLTDHGERGEYAQLTEVFQNQSNYTYPVKQLMFMMGNHDNKSNRAETIYGKALKSFNNGESYPLHTYRVIKGCPFITLSMLSRDITDVTDASKAMAAYPESSLEWLARNMARAQQECPGKPIFVFTHMPPRWTCYATWSEYENAKAWCMSILNPILNDYPQAVVFSGHSHYPIGDPRSIHQGANPDSERMNYYTVINTASTTYSELHEGAVDGGTTQPGYDSVTEGLIVTVLPNGDIEIRRFDTYRNEEIAPDSRWILRAPFDGSQFTYADVRDRDDNPLGKKLYSGGAEPYFADGAEVKLKVEGRAIRVVFPQAYDNDCVFRYSVDVINPVNGSKVVSASIFSQFYLNSHAPESLEYMIEGLMYGKEYIIEVRAYDSYDNESEPLVRSTCEIS